MANESEYPHPRPGSTVDNPEILVFDTSPLVHFSRQNWLGALKAVVGERTALVPDVAVEELREIATRDDRVKAALSAGWIHCRELRTADEILSFAHFSSLLVRGKRNRGEAGVLALARTHGATAVIDDGAGQYRLPFTTGRFEQWAHDNNLF